MAAPKECCDQRVVPATVRQLKPDMLLAAIAVSSSPSYSLTSFMRCRGNLAS